MFYSRIFEKLAAGSDLGPVGPIIRPIIGRIYGSIGPRGDSHQVGKQKGVELALFSPVNFSDRLLGLRAVLEWAKDFKMMPQRASRMCFRRSQKLYNFI